MSAPLTIILPTYDRRHVLERSIGSYLELAKRWPLLVVDDGSHDGTADWLTSLGVPVLRLPHRGLPAARNAGLAAARTKWVLFGEDDVLFTRHVPDQLLAWAGRLPRCAAVAGQLRPGESWDLPAQEPEPTIGHVLDGWRLRIDAAVAIPRATTLPSLHACALVDRMAALAVGGYDSEYAGSHYREESDLYARLWHAGGSCWLVPGCWAIHVRHRLGGGCRGSRRLAELVRNRWSYLRNDVRFAARHLRMWRRWSAGPHPGTHAAAAAFRLIANLCRQVIGR